MKTIIKSKRILIVFLILFLVSCKEKLDKYQEFKFQGIIVKVKEGNHNYFLKMIDKDSLFININLEDNYNYDYIYYTKNCIKTLSWETRGKYSKQITNIQK